MNEQEFIEKSKRLAANCSSATDDEIKIISFRKSKVGLRTWAVSPKDETWFIIRYSYDAEEFLLDSFKKTRSLTFKKSGAFKY